jgi:RNA polymerase sigma-70 factor (ECF subfamily)
VDREELRRYEAALRSYFRRRAHPADVDDLVQEALIRLFTSHPDTDVSTPLAYLFRIAANLLVDHARARRRVPVEPSSIEIERSVVASPEQELGTHLSDLQSAYSSALAELSPRCRDVFVMRRHAERSTADVAAELDISHRMVQKYMVQALELLHVRLGPFLARL